MIDRHQTELVRTIADAGSLSAAATLLHLTPSAVSHRLRKLEETLDLQLFERSVGGLRITPAGEALYAHDRHLQDRSQQVERRLAELRDHAAYRYTHGYSTAEANRLLDQASTVADFIHHDSCWPAGATVLEVGCGIGAQTKIIARQNPDCRFIGVDLSEASIAQARADPDFQGLPNVEFRVGDVYRLPELEITFAHVLVCFVLEHLRRPAEVLTLLHAALPPGGTLTAIEGDHGSAYFHPESTYADRAVAAQVALQHRNGGNANIGRQLHPLLTAAGFARPTITPRCIYVDDHSPGLKENFVLRTFTPMIAGIRDAAVAAQIETAAVLDRGLADLRRTSGVGGTFSYTFYKGVAVRQLV